MDAWYVATSSSRLKNNLLRISMPMGYIVLFRDEDGHPAALKDQCCHRGMPLSSGEISNGKITCAFHGWRFKKNGICEHIPSLLNPNDVPSKICIPSFQCHDDGHFIWVWSGKDTPVSEQKPCIPALNLSEFSNRHWIHSSVEVECDPVDAISINMDFIHLLYVHPTHYYTQKKKDHGLTETDIEIRTTDQGLIVSFGSSSKEEDPLPEDTTKIHFNLPGQVIIEEKLANKEKALCYIFVIPTGKTSCRIELVSDDLLTPDQRNFDEKVMTFTSVPKLVQEDVDVLLKTQNNKSNGNQLYTHVSADTANILMRKILKLAELGNWQDCRKKLPARTLLRVRV